MNSATAARLDEFLSDLRVLCGKYGAIIQGAHLDLDIEGNRKDGYRTVYFRDLNVAWGFAFCTPDPDFLECGPTVRHEKDLRHRL